MELGCIFCTKSEHFKAGWDCELEDGNIFSHSSTILFQQSC